MISFLAIAASTLAILSDDDEDDLKQLIDRALLVGDKNIVLEALSKQQRETLLVTIQLQSRDPATLEDAKYLRQLARLFEIEVMVTKSFGGRMPVLVKIDEVVKKYDHVYVISVDLNDDAKSLILLDWVRSRLGLDDDHPYEKSVAAEPNERPAVIQPVAWDQKEILVSITQSIPYRWKVSSRLEILQRPSVEEEQRHLETIKAKIKETQGQASEKGLPLR